MIRFFAFLLFLSSAWSCGKMGNDADSTPDRKRPNAGFELTYQDLFAETLGDVKKDSAGNIWISRSSKESPEAKVHSFLERRQPNGQLLGNVLPLGESIIAGFSPLPDGSLVAALFLKSADPEKIGYRLKLVRIDGNGQILQEKHFEDFNFPIPAGYENCDFGKDDFLHSESVQIASAGDKIVLQTFNCRFSRLTLLGPTLEVLWSKEISTQRSDDAAFYGAEVMRISADNTIVASSLIPEGDVPAFNARFSTNLAPLGKSDVLIGGFDLAGNRLYSGIMGTENYDSCGGMVLTEGTIFVAAESVVSRPTSARSYQRDIFLGAFSTASEKQEWTKVIDIKDEETVQALALVDQKFLAVGGSTDSLQVPTGSVVKHGDAFVLITDFTGAITSKKVFGTGRADFVSSILDLEDGNILVGGGKDFPITHDGDNDKTQLHHYAFIESMSPQ